MGGLFIEKSRRLSDGRAAIERFVKNPSQQAIVFFLNPRRVCQINVNAAAVVSWNVWVVFFVLFGNYGYEFILARFLVDFACYQTSLSAHTSFSLISFPCILLVKDDRDFCDVRVSDHLLHESMRVVSFSKIPFIDYYVYSVLCETFR
ncbi:hypothetical protein WJ13_32150 [Burkholderia seminalis]|nr:hypothetical protein WJ13_32150 [Burkholderia seminalis]